jgi:hypothetical protein
MKILKEVCGSLDADLMYTAFWEIIEIGKL